MLPKNLPTINNMSLTRCFACGQENPIGLKLKFKWDGQTAQAEFTPSEHHQGWQGIVHGGILFTLIDEAMAYVSYFQGLTTVTAKSDVRFKQAVPFNEPLLISATTTKISRRLLETRSNVKLKNGTVVVEGTASLYILQQNSTSPVLQEQIERDRMPTGEGQS